MSKEELKYQAGQLYDVAEISAIGAVPLGFVADTLRMLNPALENEMALEIATNHDYRGKNELSRDDFVAAVEFAMQTTDTAVAIQLVRDVVIRMRVAFRRRYLMYDAPANSPPPALLENPRSIAMFRELWGFVARDSDVMTRHQLRRLVSAVLPDAPGDASNIVKAALGDRESDGIALFEFMMVVQPATMHRTLSDMLHRARTEFGSANGAPSPPPKPAAGSGSAADGRLAVNRLAQEVALLRTADFKAEDRFQKTLGSRALDQQLPSPVARLPPPKPLADEAMERELAKLRTENAQLQHSLALALGSGPGTHSGGHHHSVNEKADRAVVQELEAEIKRLRAQLAISTEAADLSSLLRVAASQGSATHWAVLRDHFIDENPLIGKHAYVRAAARRFDDPNSPISTVLGQYELLVQGYQALYRDARGKYDALKAKRFDAASATKSIAGVGFGTPVRSAGARAAAVGALTSPVHQDATAYRWADLDREPTPDLKRTGLPGDPLLTDAERAVVRAKLAAQMRRSARHYTPTRGATSRMTSPSMAPPPVDDALVPSIDSIHLLRALRQPN
jgi:hypothetical protein